MDLPINRNKAYSMHVDLNSAYATIEQQANPLLRGKPVVVAAYATPSGAIVASSIEAKRLGIKTMMNVREARLIYKDVIVRTPDPDKYFDFHMRMRKILNNFTPDFHPGSIDEFYLNFESVDHIRPDLVKVGHEIKARARRDIGEWISLNIGISTNRFLAKLAGSLHKPDGLDSITYENLLDIYSRVSLVDLHGINVRYQARLNAHGIFNPLDFLNADCDFLQKQVFKSIVGRHWYERLRGYEVDDVEFATKSIGQQYALPRETNDTREISRIIMKLCEKMGRRLRAKRQSAYGIHVSLVYKDWTSWHRQYKFNSEMVTTLELYANSLFVFNMRPEKKPVYKMSVSCYFLQDSARSMDTLFEFNDKKEKLRKVGSAMDEVNDRYGEFVITPALMMGMENQVIKRVPFGNVKELEDFYN